MNHPNNPHTVNFFTSGQKQNITSWQVWENMPCMKRKLTKKAIEEKMPKIDTLDALDDEMTSIFNTL